MVLSSQTSRSRYSGGGRRRRRGRRLPLAIALSAVGLVGWWYYSGEEDAPAPIIADLALPPDAAAPEAITPLGSLALAADAASQAGPARAVRVPAPPPLVMARAERTAVPGTRPAPARQVEPAPVAAVASVDPATVLRFDDPVTSPASPAPPASPASPTPAASPAAPASLPRQPARSEPVAPQAAPMVAAPSDVPVTSPDAGVVAGDVRQGMALIEQGKLLDGRRKLSALLFDKRDQLAPRDAAAVRDVLMSINRVLVFSSRVHPDDAIIGTHKVDRSMPYLSQIAQLYTTPYQFIERINGVDARRVRLGQTLKILRGPIHAVVEKSTFKMDLYALENGTDPIYLWTLDVGLGEDNSTPTGRFIVRPDSKVQNPDWANPRTGQYYKADDPNIPIGEYWLGLQCLDEGKGDLAGYGIHGTNEPESIGRMMSMGCVRMRDDDVKLVYDMLTAGHSTVRIVP